MRSGETRRLVLLVSAVVVTVGSLAMLAGASRSAGSGQVSWVITDLGTFGGKESAASAINGKGQIVGWGGIGAKAQTHALLWQDGTMIDLGTLPGRTSSVAAAINEQDQIVGSSTTKTGQGRAVMWTLQP